MTAIEEQARATFLAALENAPQDPLRYLNDTCDDVQLRAKVEQLLNAHVALGSIHGAPATAAPATTDAPLRETPGEVIGPYKLLQQIGEGGMGVVWMAEQTEPIHRKVALKVIKPGMDSRQVVARFEAERQARVDLSFP